jgi:hypothetical protein
MFYERHEHVLDYIDGLSRRCMPLVQIVAELHSDEDHEEEWTRLDLIENRARTSPSIAGEDPNAREWIGT